MYGIILYVIQAKRIFLFFIVNSWKLFHYDDFFDNRIPFVVENQQINAVGIIAQIVGMTALGVEIQCKLIDQNAGHAVDFCVDFAFHIGEDEAHGAIVGIGNNIDLWRKRTILNAIERAEEPIAALDAFAQGALVEDFGS